MSESPAQPPASFAYQAQTQHGEALSGTIDAADLDQATRRLQSLQLRVLGIEPVAVGVRSSPVGGADFAAFNQQLSHLTAAGLPVEHGLRLIAQDMRTGSLAATVRLVADELERGTPLGEAFDRHRGKFPPLYGRLVEAGVRTNNLPGMLLNLGRHLELVNRLRGAIWRAMAYPLIVLIGLGVVLVFISVFILPKFEEIFRSFGTRLPGITVLLLASSGWLLPLVIGVGGAILLAFLLTPLLRRTGHDQLAADLFIMPLPMIGPILRRNLIARWCDAVKLGVVGGLDLPRAIELASNAVGSRPLRRDSRAMISAIERGEGLDRPELKLAMLPATVTATMELARNQNDLADTLSTLSEMYQQQAEMRLHLLPAILAPVLMLLTAIVIGFVVLGLFAPLISLIQAVSGSGF